MLDIVDFIAERGGNPEQIRESQRRRYANVDVVDEVISMYEDHRKSQSSPSFLHPLRGLRPANQRLKL
jgi:seryl-tRNA synthetase